MPIRLPEANVYVPEDPVTLTLMLEDQRLEWIGALASAQRGHYDGQRQARQAISNLNKLLDYYPDGMPREDIVEDRPDTTPDVTVPENIILGE